MGAEGELVEVGRALMEIRDQRLYRAEYDTFEAYCRERWGWSRRHANRQIKAAETVESIAGDGTHGSQNDDGQGTDPNDPKYRLRPKRPLPKSERVARPLTKLPEDEQADAWEEAVETAPENGGSATSWNHRMKEAPRCRWPRGRGGGRVGAAMVRAALVAPWARGGKWDGGLRGSGGQRRRAGGAG